MESLCASFPHTGVYIPEPENRGISLRQLRRVVRFVSEHSHRWKDAAFGDTLSIRSMNFRQLAEWVLRPATSQEKDCSFVEIFAEEPHPPLWAVVHSWDSNLLGWWECLEQHMETRLDDLGDDRFDIDSPYWVHAFAARPCEEVAADARPPPQREFYEAMRLSLGVLLIVNAEDSVSDSPFRRTWCLAELWIGVGKFRNYLDIATYSQKSGVELLTDGLTASEIRMERGNFGEGQKYKLAREASFPTAKLTEAMYLEVEESSTTAPEDRVVLLNWWAGREDNTQESLAWHHSYTKTNLRLRARLSRALWPQWVQTETALPTPLAAPLAADNWLSVLTLNFSFIAGMKDLHMATLAQSFPNRLQELDLSFRCCDKITDAGVVFIAEALPASLRALRLDFTSCRGLHNPSIVALAHNLPPGLGELWLNFEDCQTVSGEGATALVERVPQELRSLHLNLNETERQDDPVVLSLSQRMPQNLLCLQLRFDGSYLMTDEAAEAVAKRMPPMLQMLRLSFKDCKHMTDEGVVALAPSIPRNLTNLQISFENCRLITDTGLAALARHLPKSLIRVGLNFQGTSISEELWGPGVCRNLPILRSWQAASSAVPTPRQPSKLPREMRQGLGASASAPSFGTSAGGSGGGGAPKGLLLPSIGLRLFGGSVGDGYGSLAAAGKSESPDSDATLGEVAAGSSHRSSRQWKAKPPARHYLAEQRAPRWRPAAAGVAGESMFSVAKGAAGRIGPSGAMPRNWSSPDLGHRSGKLRVLPIWYA